MEQKRPKEGLWGRQNNMIGDTPRTASLHIRIDVERKAAYAEAAKKEGLKLSAWLIKHLDELIEKNKNNLK